MKFNTRLLHGKSIEEYPYGSTVPPIAQTSAFSYESSEALEKVFSNRAPGFSYTRIGNPTVAALERRINELEGGIGAVAASSGMSAVTLALLNVLGQGDEIIAGSGLFGGTLDLLDNLTSFGIRTRFAAHVDIAHVEPLIRENTKVIFAEIIGNPALDVVDIREMASFLHERGILFIVDATTATPYLVKPFELGADIIVHSASKYINGNGSAIAGIIVDSGKFKWDISRYPKLAPFKRMGPYAYLASLRNGIWRNMGGCLSPMNAYLCVTGLETLGLRMERECSNALRLAQALDAREDISVNYPLLPESPYRDLAEAQFGGRGGAILTLRTGSRDRALKFMDRLALGVKATNIGDIRTLVIHPASTIYIHSDKEAREAAGVYEDTIRVSLGIENVEDLIQDFSDALDCV
ncbi:MAG: O-acetylhomoserine aminocarboxypropyltransferase/cysteine synthase [Eubacterium sp.]|nr:O-acetylhomoserine aminocarboxypropyltransferase/cysteine synthase [Eubacterium sp.]